MKYDTSVTQYVDSRPVIIPGQPLEPPPGRYDGPEDDERDDEEYDNGIDLDNGYVFQFGGRNNA